MLLLESEELEEEDEEVCEFDEELEPELELEEEELLLELDPSELLLNLLGSLMFLLFLEEAITLADFDLLLALNTLLFTFTFDRED